MENRNLSSKSIATATTLLSIEIAEREKAYERYRDPAIKKWLDDCKEALEELDELHVTLV